MSNNQVSTYEQRQEWRAAHIHSASSFLTQMPKLELHIHIEGTMTPELRWKLSKRNNIPLTIGPQKTPLTSLEQTRVAYKHIRGRIGAASTKPQESFTFYEAYYGGMELLRTEEDFYDLAWEYFKRFAGMGGVYCEVFFDAQGHTRRGIGMDLVMRGFERAQARAERDLGVKSQWIMCILRDMPLESAILQYEEALVYKDMIIGIGLDGDELDHPPMLFAELFQRAREDGFKITSHCDFNQKNTHEHIRQVATKIGGTGADRVDHGLNATDDDELMAIIKGKGVGMTVCPCAYIRHTPIEDTSPRIRKLFEAGINVTVASDDPAYMEDNWVLHNLLMMRYKAGFTDKEMLRLQRNAVEICWGTDEMKKKLTKKLDDFEGPRR